MFDTLRAYIAVYVDYARFSKLQLARRIIAGLFMFSITFTTMLFLLDHHIKRDLHLVKWVSFTILSANLISCISIYGYDVVNTYNRESYF